MRVVYKNTFRTTTVVFYVLLVASVSAADSDERKETGVEPTDWGQVTGMVYDARTGGPLLGATVTVEHEGRFEAKGRTVDTTGATGQYSCEAMIGRTSASFNPGRLLVDLLASAILGDEGGISSVDCTYRVDVSQLKMRVTKQGYRPFEGVVKCRSVNPRNLEVSMEFILLANTSSEEESTTADGWGIVKILSVIVEPPVLRPGAATTITARVQCPPATKPTTITCVMRSSLWNAKSLKLTNEAISPVMLFYLTFPRSKASKLLNDPTSQEMVFSWTLRVPNRSKPLVDYVNITIEESPYELVPGGDSRSALLQVVQTDAEEKAARLRVEAQKLRDKGDQAGTLAKSGEVGRLQEANVDDSRWSTATGQATGNKNSVVTSEKRTDDKWKLDQAIAAAEQQVVVGGKWEKSKDFTAWHTLAILLYTKACEQKKFSDPSVVETMRRFREALIDALENGRGAAKEETADHRHHHSSSTDFLYSGFANRLADADFMILQSLRVLDKYPDNYLAHFTLAAAFAELGRYDFAEVEARKCLELKPDYVEAKFLIGIAAMRSGNKNQAPTLLQEVLKANPRHPKASFVLADLYTRSGNAEAAATCLAAYNKYYNRG